MLGGYLSDVFWGVNNRLESFQNQRTAGFGHYRLPMKEPPVLVTLEEERLYTRAFFFFFSKFFNPWLYIRTGFFDYFHERFNNELASFVTGYLIFSKHLKTAVT